MKKIDTMEKWNILAGAMIEKGYRLWQMQYDCDLPEGFHAWFCKENKHDVEIVTFNKDVKHAILNYNKDYNLVKKVLICGSRYYSNYEKVLKIIKNLNSQYGNIIIIEGGARGADSLAKKPV